MLNSKLFIDWAGICFMLSMLMLTIATIFDNVKKSAPIIMMMAGLMGLFLFIGLVKKFVFEVEDE